MGTTFSEGKKPENKITISRGGDVPARKLDTTTGKVDRSFAQPSPTVEQPVVVPKVHANKEDAAEALEKNSKKKRKYVPQDSRGLGSTKPPE